ncbi:MAG: bifunctional metallophosphatase/5'-nucleotidase, partial [Polyangiaceae bacterium]
MLVLRPLRRILAVATTSTLCACGLAGHAPVSPTSCAAPAVPAPADAPAPRPALVHVQVLAFNDLHGHLEPPAGDTTGGVAWLAAHVERLRAENPATVVVSAGDLTGASPLVSNLFD